MAKQGPDGRSVYQDVFGGEVYPSLEEKAANLLYFMIKDHPGLYIPRIPG